MNQSCPIKPVEAALEAASSPLQHAVLHSERVRPPAEGVMRHLQALRCGIQRLDAWLDAAGNRVADSFKVPPGG